MEHLKRMVIIGALVGMVLGLFGALSQMAFADTNVQQSNSCEDCEANTGDANSNNGASAFAGHQSGPTGSNVQDGNNEVNGSQESDANSGDASTGQVTGVVDGDGDVTIVSSNHCEDCTVNTGNANANNGASILAGLIAGASGTNVQDGDNLANLSQAANANTGDGITGQVTGVI